MSSWWLLPVLVVTLQCLYLTPSLPPADMVPLDKTYMDRAHKNLLGVSMNAESGLTKLFTLCGKGEEVVPEMKEK